MVKNKFKIFTVIFLLLCSSCTTYKDRYIDRVVYVNVPVMITPSIEKIDRPKFPIESLSETSSIRDVVESYYNTILIYKVYTNTLETALSQFYSNSTKD